MIQAARIAGEIQEMIRREGIEPGGRLPTEHTFARRFRVSRPIVREALQALKALGVVESRPRVGLRVLPFDPGAHMSRMIPRIRTREEREELYEFRCLLEPGILRLVVRRAPRPELDRLEEMLEAPLPRGRAAVREGLARDIAFHEGLWRLAGNRFVWSLRELLVRFFAELEQRRVTEAIVRKTNAEHLAIVRALRAGDLEKAERALARNLGTFPPDGRDGR